MFEIAAFFLIELNKKEESDFWEVKLKLAFLLFGSAIFSDFISFFLGVEASCFLDEKIFFSELTFFPGNGMIPYNPIEWDKKLGDMLDLSNI